MVPFVGGDDAGDEIEREDFLDAAGVAVDGEGDALVAEEDIGHSAAFFEGGLSEVAKAGDEG